MAPEPKRRISRRRKNIRRGAKKLTVPQLVKCTNPACGKQTLPHQACGHCGYYKGEKVTS